MPNTIDCSICGKKYIAFRGSILSRVGYCMDCYNREKRIIIRSDDGSTVSIPKTMKK